MSDSYVKDIVYDLIASKLKIKELEDKLAFFENKNKELTSVNTLLKEEVNKWKSQIVAYINDYRDIYSKNDEKSEIVETNTVINEVVNTENINAVEENIDNNDTVTKKTRNEYMKEYMKNKRKNKKEEMKSIIVNKK